MALNLATAPHLEAEDTTETDGFDAVDLAIRRFLDGTTDGQALFEALYGATLDEPIPAHLLETVRKG